MTESVPRVLVVDDEESICWAFDRLLSGEGYHVITASSAEEGLQRAAEQPLSLVLLDVRLPGRDGITSIPDFRRITDSTPVVVMTAFGDLQTAVSAVKAGAFDYLIKPFRLQDALAICRQAVRFGRHLPTASRRESNKTPGQNCLVGQSPAMQQTFRQIALVAPSELSVLISGETGTGKELVAAAIVAHSHRADQPYLPIAPVALNPDLIESELFGHVKGAFTGAVEDRAGLFERADGGTILLDEIGDLSQSMQVKLLRVLESGRFCRVGDTRSRVCDVRILAATHRDLNECLRQGTFREDLFYRLNGLHIHLPPLRERLEDLPLLCQHFLFSAGFSIPDDFMDEALLAQLARRSWYGNVRELRNAIHHAAVLARGRALTLDDFPPAIPGVRQDDVTPQDDVAHAVEKWTQWAMESHDPPLDDLHAKLMATVETALFSRVMQACGGNRAKAAAMLGIHRGTLRERLRSYGLGDSVNDE